MTFHLKIMKGVRYHEKEITDNCFGLDCDICFAFNNLRWPRNYPDNTLPTKYRYSGDIIRRPRNYPDKTIPAGLTTLRKSWKTKEIRPCANPSDSSTRSNNFVPTNIWVVGVELFARVDESLRLSKNACFVTGLMMTDSPSKQGWAAYSALF